MAETIKIVLEDETPDKGPESTTPDSQSQPESPASQPGAVATKNAGSLQSEVFGSESPREARKREMDNRQLAIDEARERREGGSQKKETSAKDREMNARVKRERDKDDIFLALMGRPRERPDHLKEGNLNKDFDPEVVKAVEDTTAAVKDGLEKLSGMLGGKNASDGPAPIEDGDTSAESTSLIDKFKDILSGKKAEDAAETEGGGAAELAKDAIGQSIGQKISKGLAEFLGKSSAGRGVLSFGANLGITGARAGAAAAGGAGGAAAGGAAGAGGAAALSGGPVTLAIAGVVLALVGLAVGIKAVIGLYNRQGDELEQFNGAIFGARANIEAINIGNKIERGQRIGGAIAQVEGAQGRFNDAMFDLATEIYDELAKLAPLLEAGIDFATFIVRSLETILNLLEALAEFLQGDFAGSADELKQAFNSGVKATKALASIFGPDLDQGPQGANPGVDVILNHNPLPNQPQPNQQPNQQPPARPRQPFQLFPI